MYHWAFQGLALSVLVLLVEEVNQLLIELLPLEVFLKLNVLIKKSLQNRNSNNIELKRVNQCLQSILNIEVVDHVFVLEVVTKLFRLVLSDLMITELLHCMS